MDGASEALHDEHFPNESEAYRAARDELLGAEVELRHHTEKVAALRRDLPLGGEIAEDYVFSEWDEKTNTVRPVRLSELFAADKDTLFVYSFMFVPDEAGNPIGSPCPNCTSIIDAVAGEARHVTQRINFAVSAKVPIEQFREHGQSRGWANTRSQWPMATVFVRRDGRIYHSWSSELFLVSQPAAETRHVDFMWPLWSILDCTPEGRGDWMPALRYS